MCFRLRNAFLGACGQRSENTWSTQASKTGCSMGKPVTARNFTGTSFTDLPSSEKSKPVPVGLTPLLSLSVQALRKDTASQGFDPGFQPGR